MTQPHSDDNQTSWTAPHSDAAGELLPPTAQPSDGGVYAGRTDAPLPPGGLPLLDGKYLATERCAGGMGVVYKCIKRATGQVVALKTVLSDGPMSEGEIKSMRHNYDRVHKLSHDHIVRLNALEVDERNGQWYVEMDWVEGESLKDHLRQFGGDLRETAKETLRVLRQVAESLDYAHGRGIVHRDVKDANIMIEKATGNVVLIDFGIASRASHQVSQNGTVAHDVTATTTTASVFAGTRGYQSPEQWRGDRAEASSDEYSLAVTAYRCLSGHLPFWSDNEGLLQEMVLNDDVPPVKSLPDEVNVVLKKGLAKKPSERYGTCRAFIDALKKGLSSMMAAEPTASTTKDAADAKKDESFSMAEFYILSGEMDEKFTECGKREWDRGQTFGIHLDAFNKACRGAKGAVGIKDFAFAYKFYKQAEGEWKWLEANEPLRKSAADVREKAVVAQKTAEEAEAGRLADDKLQEAVNLLKTADGDFESGRFEEAEKGFASADGAFAKAAEMARLAKRIMDLEKSIKKAIDENCFQNARLDIAVLKKRDAAKAASWEATLEAVWKAHRIAHLEKGISQAIGEMRFQEARQTIEELKKLDVEKASSWDAAIAKAETAWKTERIRQLEEYITVDISIKRFEDARQAVAELKKLDAVKAVSWESVINAAEVNWKTERIEELERDISIAINEKRFQDAYKEIEELRKLDAAKAASLKAEIDSAEKAGNIQAWEKAIREAIDGKRFKDARKDIDELKGLDAAKAASWDAMAKTAERKTMIARTIGVAASVTVIILVLTVLFRPYTPDIKPTSREEGGNYIVTLKPGVEIKLVKVEAGSFMMGSENGESWEKPVHKVTLTKDFWICETEVTQAQYEAVMEKNPSYFNNGGDYPVEYVSWKEAVKFCDALNRVCKNQFPSGYQFALPTEAQWEYAARGGNKSKGYQYSGSDNLNDVGWYDKNIGDSKHFVRQKKPNELGIYDMSGNVWEWCLDSCEWLNGLVTDTYKDDVIDPKCRNGSGRVYRGGSWLNYAKDCRSAYRKGINPSLSCNNIGFRIALTRVQ